ncbi:MAG: helix-turn-helix transcriptional regulator [Clostridiaceae bacterium]
MNKIDINKLSELVKLKRKEKNLTQSQLENLTSINRQIIGRIELSQFIPSIKQLEALLETLGIDFADIIEDNSEPSVLLAMRGKAESSEETEALDHMISMMLCLKKHDILRSRLNG